MKKQTSSNVKLGIFVTIGFVLLMAVVYFISARQQLFNKTFRISAIFSDVSGLQAGNNVRFSGITVGIIQSIKIESDTAVRVEMLLNEDVRRFIKKDAEGSIGSDGLMGNKILTITPGTVSQPEIEDNDVIKSVPPLNFDRALYTLKSTGDNVAQITGDLADIVHTIREGKGTIGQLFMDSTYLKDTRENLNQVTSDLAAITGTVRSGKSSMGKLLMDSTYLNIPIDNTIHMTGDLREIIGSVREGRGVLGRLLMDSSMAVTMDSTMVNLKQGSAQMKRVMEKARNSFLLWGF